MWLSDLDGAYLISVLVECGACGQRVALAKRSDAEGWAQSHYAPKVVGYVEACSAGHWHRWSDLGHGVWQEAIFAEGGRSW